MMLYRSATLLLCVLMATAALIGSTAGEEIASTTSPPPTSPTSPTSQTATSVQTAPTVPDKPEKPEHTSLFDRCVHHVSCEKPALNCRWHKECSKGWLWSDLDGLVYKCMLLMIGLTGLIIALAWIVCRYVIEVI